MTEANLWTVFAPAVYIAWANYWLAAKYSPPPLRLHKPTASGGAVFLAPVGSPWVREFVEAHRNDTEFYFENQGEELVSGDPNHLGTWGSFSAIWRTALPEPVGRPMLPMPLPRTPEYRELRRQRPR